MERGPNCWLWLTYHTGVSIASHSARWACAQMGTPRWIPQQNSIAPRRWEQAMDSREGSDTSLPGTLHEAALPVASNLFILSHSSLFTLKIIILFAYLVQQIHLGFELGLNVIVHGKSPFGGKFVDRRENHGIIWSQIHPECCFWEEDR